MSQRHLHRLKQRQRYVERTAPLNPWTVDGREIHERPGYSSERNPRNQTFEDCDFIRCTMSYFVKGGSTYKIGNYECAVLPEIHIEGTLEITGTGILGLTG